MINIELTKPADQATVYVDETEALIEVTSATGIGSLTATLSEGQWPPKIVTRLRLQGLEHMEIRYGDTTLETGVSSNSNPNPALKLSVTQPDGSVKSGYPSADLYAPDIQPGSDDRGHYFDVAMPSHFYTGDYPSFSVHWIDFYR